MTTALSSPCLIQSRDGRGRQLIAVDPQGAPAPSFAGRSGVFVRTARHETFDVLYPSAWERDDALRWLCTQEMLQRAEIIACADWSTGELSNFALALTA